MVALVQVLALALVAFLMLQEARGQSLAMRLCFAHGVHFLPIRLHQGEKQHCALHRKPPL